MHRSCGLSGGRQLLYVYLKNWIIHRRGGVPSLSGYLGEESLVADIHPQARPFFLKGGPVTCLLIHGFTTSPSEMRHLGEKLHEEGFTVSAPLLPGHGSTPEDLNRTTWWDWYGAVKEEAQKLDDSYRQLYLIGLSMGGLLALKTAADLEGVAGVATINTPIYLKGYLIPFAPILKFVKPYVPKKIDENYREMKKRERFAYDDIPVKAFLSMRQLTKMVVRSLKKVVAPVLIFQSEEDESVEKKSALVIRDQVTGDKRLVWLQKSSHVATMGPEIDFISQEIIGFIKQNNDNNQ